MNIDTNTIVPISVANQNFSKVARLVDQYGSAVIMKNNTPGISSTNSTKRTPCRRQPTTMCLLPPRSSCSATRMYMRNWQNEASQ